MNYCDHRDPHTGRHVRVCPCVEDRELRMRTDPLTAFAVHLLGGALVGLPLGVIAGAPSNHTGHGAAVAVLACAVGNAVVRMVRADHERRQPDGSRKLPAMAPAVDGSRKSPAMACDFGLGCSITPMPGGTRCRDHY